MATATSTPSVQVSYAFFFNLIVNLTTNVKPFITFSLLPLRIYALILVQSQMFSRELACWFGWGLIILYAFLFWFPPLLFSPLACSTTCQWLLENSDWFDKNFLALDLRAVLPPPMFETPCSELAFPISPPKKKNDVSRRTCILIFFFHFAFDINLLFLGFFVSESKPKKLILMSNIL